MPLELDRLVKAVDALNADLRDTVKAGVIKNFEVAYEQCGKFIQRWIRENRMTARYELISDPLSWHAIDPTFRKGIEAKYEVVA